MRRQVHTQLEVSLAKFQATGTETALSLCGLDYIPFGLYPTNSTICQGTPEESHVPLPQVTGPQSSALAVDTEVYHKPIPGPLSCGPGVALPIQEPKGDVPVRDFGGKPAAFDLIMDPEML